MCLPLNDRTGLDHVDHPFACSSASWIGTRLRAVHQCGIVIRAVGKISAAHTLANLLIRRTLLQCGCGQNHDDQVRVSSSAAS
jgi:hypothetical protein